MSQKHEDFYLRIRQKITAWLESKQGKSYKWNQYILIAPDMFYLLYKLSLDPDVPSEAKGKLILAIAYFISPLDLIPEALTGPVGYVDDIALSAYVLNSIMNKVSPETIRKHWAGEEDVLELVQRIVSEADKMVGSGLWKKIRGMFR
ncbi:MAG: YkvA family protein [candidate division KSB1 bacterium]|jgi:uncharacterized membrane protein YkvA (DUF1232 family)|nr:YkvA family protein [candidate division KSB1 bacterium]